MNNHELAEAIDVTYQKVITRGTGTDSYRVMLEHLESLLKEQAKRATTNREAC